MAADEPASGTSDGTARRPRVLVYAYHISPHEGSEPGAGWSMIRHLAGWCEPWVLTRTTPPRAGDYSPWTDPDPLLRDVRWVHEPLPGDPIVDDGSWVPSRLARRLPYIDYVRWQRRALRRARSLERRTMFDLVWHVNWANAWLGTTAGSVGPPLVLGPVGGGVDPPWRLVPGLGTRGALAEVARWLVRLVMRYLNPLARGSWSRARLVLVQNPETRDWLPRSVRARCVVFQNTSVDPAELPHCSGRRPQVGADDPTPRTAVFAGRLVAWKGAHLAIRAIAQASDWRLVVLGSGPERRRLENLAHHLGVSDRVEFRGALSREAVISVLCDEADVLLFPSLHDEGGMIVAESVALGLPVVCLAHGGPRVMVGNGVEPAGPARTIASLAAALDAAIGTRPAPLEDLATRRRRLRDLVVGAGLVPPDPPRSP